MWSLIFLFFFSVPRIINHGRAEKLRIFKIIHVIWHAVRCNSFDVYTARNSLVFLRPGYESLKRWTVAFYRACYWLLIYWHDVDEDSIYAIYFIGDELTIEIKSYFFKLDRVVVLYFK